jgi:uncharacterized OsmC-like protein
MRIAAVKLRYPLKIPRGKRGEADRALELHERNCPVHQSIQRGFKVIWSADIEEN